jgi:hypothetical protein
MGNDPKYDGRLSRDVNPKDRVLLVRLMEEAAELQHACAKTLRWGWDSTNPELNTGETNEQYIERELNDVVEMARRLDFLKEPRS